MLKIKDNIKLIDLEKLGFKEHTFGLYGPGDYLPTYWYDKDYYYKGKHYYIQTNPRYFCERADTLTNFFLYKLTKTKNKSIPLKGHKKIVKIVLDDLLEMGLVEKVADHEK